MSCLMKNWCKKIHFRYLFPKCLSSELEFSKFSALVSCNSKIMLSGIGGRSITKPAFGELNSSSSTEYPGLWTSHAKATISLPKYVKFHTSIPGLVLPLGKKNRKKISRDRRKKRPQTKALSTPFERRVDLCGGAPDPPPLQEDMVKEVSYLPYANPAEWPPLITVRRGSALDPPPMQEYVVMEVSDLPNTSPAVLRLRGGAADPLPMPEGLSKEVADLLEKLQSFVNKCSEHFLNVELGAACPRVTQKSGSLEFQGYTYKRSNKI